MFGINFPFRQIDKISTKHLVLAELVCKLVGRPTTAGSPSNHHKLVRELPVDEGVGNFHKVQTFC